MCNSYKDLFDSFITPNDLVQFILLYEKYSEIYFLNHNFYAVRGGYLNDYAANSNLTDMGRHYNVDLRDETKILDFEGVGTIYDILKETLNKQG